MCKRSNSLFLPYNESSQSQNHKVTHTVDNTEQQATRKKHKTTHLSSTAALKQKHALEQKQHHQDKQSTDNTSNNDTSTEHTVNKETQSQRKRHRSNQERPQELSSAKPISQLVALNNTLSQQHITTYKPADPRFTIDSSFNTTMYNRAYKFIDEIKQSEMDELKQKINSKSITEQQRTEYKHQLKQLIQTSKQSHHTQQQHSLIQQWKKSERQLQSQGKTPYYLKQSEQKKLLLAQKYMNLKHSGHSGINKYMEKKQKQTTQTARKYIPKP